MGVVDGDKVRIRHRRRGLVTGQGDHGRLDRGAVRGARPQGHADEVRPVHQRGPRHHVTVPARRGVRHRRRGRDRPRPGPLRALHQRGDLAQEQPHHRPGVPVRDREGEARRLPGLHGAGHPAHHRRDQGRHPRRGRRLRRGDRRDRRNRWRHRVAAFPRGDPPVPPGRRTRQRHQRARHARAVPGRHRRAQDQAHPALGQGAALDRNPARRAGVPGGPPPPRGDAPQDRALLQR